MMHSNVRHDALICLIWPIHTCRMIHLYGVTWLIHIWRMPHPCVRHCSCLYHPSSANEMTHYCVWYNSFVLRVGLKIRMTDPTFVSFRAACVTGITISASPNRWQYSKVGICVHLTHWQIIRLFCQRAAEEKPPTFKIGNPLRNRHQIQSRVLKERVFAHQQYVSDYCLVQNSIKVWTCTRNKWCTHNPDSARDFGYDNGNTLFKKFCL